ncbi:Bor family protein, partial [Escherichia coli]|nr:Bor family protein [Escherichia coli]
SHRALSEHKTLSVSWSHYPITHHFFVSGIGQKKTVDAAKICGGAENVVKTETQQTFVNGLLGFITLGIYTPLEARVYCSQ